MFQSQDLGTLKSYIRHLRHAVATTTCRTTADTLKQMLSEAEASLQKKEHKRVGASNSELH